MPLNEYEFPTSKVANVQSQLEKLVAKNYYLHSSARDAYRCLSRPFSVTPALHSAHIHGITTASISELERCESLLSSPYRMLRHQLFPKPATAGAWPQSFCPCAGRTSWHTTPIS